MKRLDNFQLSTLNFQLIITSPKFLKNENELISSLFKAGLKVLHLRKPDATKAEYEQLLNSIPQKYHERIMLHDFFELTEKYNVRGVHLNRRNPEYNGTKKAKISKSCHSIQELEIIDEYDYVFLSPVFDSISKEGYRANFSHEELLIASQTGLINEKVIALGGINGDTLPLLSSYKFGGIGLLGAIWGDDSDCYEEEVVKRFLDLCPNPYPQERFSPFQFITHQTEKYDCFQSAQLALEGGCKWIQLRMKEAYKEEVESMALRIKPLCKKHDAIFLINDHVDICKKTGADGVHLGKNDMPPAEARKILGNRFIIGGTCNTYEDILAVKDHVDYVGCGPFRFTETKKKLSPTIGLDGYRNIVWNCRSNGINLPIIAIGGITADDITNIFNAGANGIALSGAILNAENPAAETERIVKTIFNL